MAFKVDGKTLGASDQDVLDTLKFELAKRGIERFRVFKPSGDNIMTNCPFHGDPVGQERRPSMGVLIQDNEYVKAGHCRCFACGWSGTLEEMVSNVFGYNDYGKFGRTWLYGQFLDYSVSARQPIIVDTSRNKIAKKEKQKFISEKRLAQFRVKHPYMYKRKMTDDVIEMFDIGYDARFKPKTMTKPIPSITFPVRDVEGRCLFIARRSVKGKFFHLASGATKPLYGIYELMKYRPDAKKVIIVESQINCTTVWAYGDVALATFGTGDEEQYKLIAALPQREICIAFDPDSAGYIGMLKMANALKDKKIITRLIMPNGKDINDLTKKEYKQLKEVYI